MLSPMNTHTDGFNSHRLSESDAILTMRDMGLNFQSIKNESTRKRIQRAMTRHCDNMNKWNRAVDECKSYRTKRKGGQNKLLGPKRTLLELQAAYRESLIPQDLKEQVYQRYHKF